MSAPERIWAAPVTDSYGEWQTTTDGLPRPTEYVRADLYAALEAQLAERVKVKPLEWRGTEGIWAKADALFGATYRITEYAGMAKPFKLETVGFVGPNGHYGTLDEAKAAAQADYERRIRPALEATPPAPMVTEEMVEALKSARSVLYDTQQACLFEEDDGQIGVTEEAVISPYHFQKLCRALGAVDNALTAAQEAGRALDRQRQPDGNRQGRSGR